MNINTALCREILRRVQDDVRKYKPGIRLKDAWVWKGGRDLWEFHYQKFYWWGSADNAYDARARAGEHGWLK